MKDKEKVKGRVQLRFSLVLRIEFIQGFVAVRLIRMLGKG